MTDSCNIELFPEQFILKKFNKDFPEGWNVESILEWNLGSHRSLPIIHLLKETGRAAGWLLGYAVNESGKLLENKDVLYLPVSAENQEEKEEEFIYRLGGRFLVILAENRLPRIYLDPFGSLSAVYCEHQRVVGSTPNLFAVDEQTGDRLDLARALGIPYRNGMYPLNLTPRLSINRLLPNHYLDLNTWQCFRHWPKNPLAGKSSTDEAIGIVTATTKRNIEAITKANSAYLSLTAGKDSRMLLACSKNIVERLELFTVPLGDLCSRNDLKVATKIAQRFNIKQFIPKPVKPRQDDLDEWMHRISYSTGEVRGWQAVTMYRQANCSYAIMTGIGGELSRDILWDWSNNGELSGITTEIMLNLCGAPLSKDTIACIERWKNKVRADDAYQMIDLFFLEQRIGCWAGIWPYAECNDPGFTIFPLCHRDIVTAMLTLPKAYRRSGYFMRDVINREWPELLQWQFNKPGILMRMTNQVEFFSGKISSAFHPPPQTASKALMFCTNMMIKKNTLT